MDLDLQWAIDELKAEERELRAHMTACAVQLGAIQRARTMLAAGWSLAEVRAFRAARLPSTTPITIDS